MCICAYVAMKNLWLLINEVIRPLLATVSLVLQYAMWLLTLLAHGLAMHISIFVATLQQGVPTLLSDLVCPS